MAPHPFNPRSEVHHALHTQPGASPAFRAVSTAPDPRKTVLLFPKAAAASTPEPAPKRTKGKPSAPVTVTGNRNVTKAKDAPIKRNAHDWEAIERDYRANTCSVRELASRHGLSHTAIRLKAKNYRWERDLTDIVLRRVEEKIAAAELAKGDPVESGKLDIAIVERQSDIIAAVRIGQRQRFSSMAQLSTKMFIAISQEFDQRESLETLGDLMETYDPNTGKPDRLSQMYREAIALPGQIKAFKDLTEIIAKLTDMETRAFKLEKAPDGNDNSRSSLPVRFIDAPIVREVEDDELPEDD